MVEINNTVGYLYEQTITQEELEPVVETATSKYRTWWYHRYT